MSLLVRVAPLHAQAPAVGDPAAWLSAQSALCDAAIADAERRNAIPSGLLLAIAKAESGRPLPPHGGLGPWPWTINLDGAGSFYDTAAAAVAEAHDALRRSRRPDVGCLQVSLAHHPAAFAGLEHAFDPALNADYAARFLARLRGEAGGNWRVATGFYHSRTPALAAAYRARVDAVLAGLPPPCATPPRLQARALQRGVLWQETAGGAVRIVRAGTGQDRGRPGGCEILPGRAVRCRAKR